MLNFDGGSLVIAVIASAATAGSYEVYAENTTGWEPVVGEDGAPEIRSGGHHDCTLLRYTTTDFVTYSAPYIALQIPGCSGTPTMKSIARSDRGLYAMFTVGDNVANNGLGTYTSHDAGMSWSVGKTTGVVSPDKDDLNIIYSGGRFVDMYGTLPSQAAVHP
jgi:hypothetical protein